MHDALARVVEIGQVDAVPRGVGAQLRDHARKLGIGDCARPPRARCVMVGDGEGQIGAAQRAGLMVQHAECVEAALVHVMPVYRQQRLAVLPHRNHVRVPKLVEHRPAHNAQCRGPRSR